MNFLDGTLFPKNQEKLVITAAPYGPEWIPSDFPEDIAVSWTSRYRRQVDSYNAGATVLHVHVRETDGRGSKRLSQFNKLLADGGSPCPTWAASRRFDLLRAGERRGGGEVAVGRHAAYARRADAKAGPGYGHGQYGADEHRRADGADRLRRNFSGRAQHLGRLPRDGRPGRAASRSTSGG
jgi:hypothetical protein